MRSVIEKRNNAALDAIIIYISAKKSLTRQKPARYRWGVRWWISWGGRAEVRSCGDSIDVRGLSSLEMVPQNRDVSGLHLPGLEPSDAASLLL